MSVSSSSSSKMVFFLNVEEKGFEVVDKRAAVLEAVERCAPTVISTTLVCSVLELLIVFHEGVDLTSENALAKLPNEGRGFTSSSSSTSARLLGFVNEELVDVVDVDADDDDAFEDVDTTEDDCALLDLDVVVVVVVEEEEEEPSTGSQSTSSFAALRAAFAALRASLSLIASFDVLSFPVLS